VVVLRAREDEGVGEESVLGLVVLSQVGVEHGAHGLIPGRPALLPLVGAMDTRQASRRSGARCRPGRGVRTSAASDRRARRHRGGYGPARPPAPPRGRPRRRVLAARRGWCRCRPCMTPGWCLDHSDPHRLSALGGTRTPNLLIRRRSRRVQRVCSRSLQALEQGIRDSRRPLVLPMSTVYRCVD